MKTMLFAILVYSLTSPALAQSTTAPASTQPTSQPTSAPVEASVPAETPKPPAQRQLPTLSGFVEVSYNVNFNNPVDNVNVLQIYHGVQNTILLNTAHLVIAGSPVEGLSYALELDFGSDAQVNGSVNSILAADADGDAVSVKDDFDIQEAYVTYVSPLKLGVKAGKFSSYQGIEVIESPANPTISRGIIFGFATPFTHTGALLTYQVTDKLDVAVGAINGFDLLIDNNEGKTAVAKLGLNLGDSLSLVASSLTGLEQVGNANRRTIADFVGVTKVIPGVDLWFGGNFGVEQGASVVVAGGDARWFGFSLQPLVRLSDSFAVGARAEFFSDTDGARTGVAQRLFTASLSPSYQLLPGLTVRAEGRLDFSDQQVFHTDDAATLTTQQALFLSELILSF